MQTFHLNDIRRERNKLLRRSDWTQLPDTKVKDPVAWLEYRHH